MRRYDELLPDWAERAACAGMDTNLFFPPPGREGHVWTVRAKKICARCAYRRECLEWAYELERGGRWGIYGGATARERRRYAKHPDRLAIIERRFQGWMSG